MGINACILCHGHLWINTLVNHGRNVRWNSINGKWLEFWTISRYLSLFSIRRSLGISILDSWLFLRIVGKVVFLAVLALNYLAMKYVFLKFTRCIVQVFCQICPVAFSLVSVKEPSTDPTPKNIWNSHEIPAPMWPKTEAPHRISHPLYSSILGNQQPKSYHEKTTTSPFFEAPPSMFCFWLQNKILIFHQPFHVLRC